MGGITSQYKTMVTLYAFVLMNPTNKVDSEDDENSLTFFLAQTEKTTAKTKPISNHLGRTNENAKIVVYNIYMM